MTKKRGREGWKGGREREGGRGRREGRVRKVGRSRVGYGRRGQMYVDRE